MPDEVVMSKIYLIRAQKMMLDADLAVLYGVSTGNLNKAVQRNIRRFPDDFMFQLTKKEFDDLIFQSGISSWGGTRKLPYAFTEQGVAMLSSVLHSDRAIMVNIQIVRVFTRMRQLLETHTEILRKLDQLQKKDIEQDQQILLIFEYLKQLEQAKQQQEDLSNRGRIGFKRDDET
ncbi:MAG: ORF6N domain-containing protein [Bacteroidales bacterium]|nr:ORF6N domain-containing protein [Bacteroidales bacterium]